VFAWNLWKHIRLPRWGFDFDGVFCRDPEKAENDDGEVYARFLSRAEPLFIPQRKIGHIITGRLDRYRGETVAWLRRHGIEFESLTMAPFNTKAKRMAGMKAMGGRGVWKAQQAKRIGVEMFVESCPKQSAIIAREAAIPVFCTLTQSAYRP
jgi:orotate phosphoribosyltransferase